MSEHHLKLIRVLDNAFSNATGVYVVHLGFSRYRAYVKCGSVWITARFLADVELLIGTDIIHYTNVMDALERSNEPVAHYFLGDAA
jgi:hypothetical protein